MSAGASCPPDPARPDPARPDPVVRSRRHWLAAAPLGLTALALQPTPLWAATAAPALGDPVLWPTVTLLDGRVFGPIKESTIVGRAFLIIWPVGRLHWL